jgi:hypothetical protein
MNNEIIKKNRVAVASLVRFVLIGDLCSREAVNQFPPDTGDESIEAAYHALVHYEADEDLRKRDSLYKQEQDDYLMMIADTLESGENLPQNIIESYKKFYKSTSIPHAKNRSGLLKSFWRNLNI